MANRSFRGLKTLGAGRVLLAFKIAPNGVGVPTIEEDGDDAVASISRTGVGVYAVVLKDTYLALVSWDFELQLNAAADTQVQLTGAQPVSTTKTLTLTILTAGSAADIAANANNKIGVTLVMRDSTLG